MSQTGQVTRRRLLRTAGAAAGGLALAGCGATKEMAATGGGGPAGEQGISPVEDLMREHGVLRRVLLIYDQAARLMQTATLPSGEVHQAADVVRAFIEAYHEKLEEDHVFPRFRKAGRFVELVDTLQAQHEAGRRLTSRVLQRTAPGRKLQGAELQALRWDLERFARMYRPHAAREDTVLFVALREVVAREEYAELGERFEDIEHQTFGKEGFELFVDRVAGIEKKLGIHDLAAFTPEFPRPEGD